MSIALPIELPWQQRLVDDMIDAYAQTDPDRDQGA
jgi:hypothetical protein